MAGRISKLRSKIMAAVKSKNTRPEIALRKCLSARGLRYRLHRRSLPGCPDIVFVKHKLAVFCDGDFWHGKNWRSRKANGEFKVRKGYWVGKIEGNIARDRRLRKKLKAMGWQVIRVWESDIHKDVEGVAGKITKALARSHACTQPSK